MKTRIEKLGKSVAVRIPKSLAARAGLGVGAVVHISLVAGKLVISPDPERPALEKLLAGITPANRHPEVRW
jgi:antitoxin component of MazEF toxin-antitoxin module